MEKLLDGIEDVKFGADMRKEFSLLEGQTFLNHGSYGSVPKRIQEIKRRYMLEMEQHPDDWFRRNVYKYWLRSKTAAADFLHCDPQDLVFVENATTGVNTVLKSFPYKAGDVIMYTRLVYPAVGITCDATAGLFKSLGVESRTLDLKLPIASEEEVLQKYEEFLKANPKTKMAVVDYITSPTAILLPVKKIVDLCHKYGVLVMIDGAHIPGQVHVNLTELGADFFTGNFHKWMFTPRGCAVLHVQREHHSWVQPLVTSWNHKDTLDKQFFLVATIDQSNYVVVRHTIDFFNRIGGWDAVHGYCSKLATEAHDYLLHKLKLERLPIPKNMESPYMRVIKLPQLPQYSLDRAGSIDFHTDIRNKYNIQTAIELEVTGGNLNLRISVSIYNCMDDYVKLANCLAEILNTT